MATPARFKAKKTIDRVLDKKANEAHPIYAEVGNGAGVVATGRDNFYWIRLYEDDDRRAQVFSLIPLTDGDKIYVKEVRDRKIRYYELLAFIEDAGGGTDPPVQEHDLLGPGHDDTTAASPPTRGDVMTGQGAAPSTWTRLPAAVAGAVLIGDGIDVISDTTPTLAGLLTLGAGALLTGGVLDADGIADAVVLDANGDTTISAPADDQIDIEIAGTDYGELIERVLGWDEVVDVGTWYDFKLVDPTEGDHFRQNLGVFPAGWTEVDAANITRTDFLFSFWFLNGTSVDTSWKYRKQSGVAISDVAANRYVAFLFGPLLWRDGDYPADLHYYFGIYSDDGLGAIDEDIYIRMHLWWNSGAGIWQIRAEEGDGSAGGEFTNPDHMGAWETFYFPIHQPIWVGAHVQNSANQVCRGYVGTTPIQGSWTLNLSQVPTNPNWDTTEHVWVQFHQTRGAGKADYLYIGAMDYEDLSL